jgi:ribosome-associated protein
MSQLSVKDRGIVRECIFTASRSTGPGGQNVNKVSSKIELRFSISDSSVLSEVEKDTLLQKLHNRITASGEFILTSQTSRSQLKNKELVTEKFYILIDKALKHPKKRNPTSPTRASKEKRILNKKKLGEKKKLRGFPDISE